MIGSIVSLIDTALNKFIADPEAKAKAKLAMLEAHQNGEMKELELSMSAIVSESQSKDKWTSRARPSFMYVMYILLLSALPMGLFFMFDAANAQLMVEGFKMWLGAIPEQMWALFGVGYLGYTGARSFDKRKK